MNKLSRQHIKFTFLTTALLLLGGAAWAQTDSPYVLKKKVVEGDNGTLHYLAHVNGVLQDVNDFNPETCIWYSGPKFNITGNHHNYYFYDEAANKYHFLAAPLATNQDLGLSTNLPTSSQLKNPDDIYYFYDWDWDAYGGGVARGHDFGNGSWEVHWVAYSDFYDKWTTTADYYNLSDSCARFRPVTITPHERAVDWTENHVGSLSDFVMNYDENPANTAHALSISIGDYSYTCTPAYITYTFEGTDYDFCNGVPGTPSTSEPVHGNTASSYEWTITGEGMDYLSFSSTSHDLTSTIEAPSVYYTNENTQGTKTAKLTLTLTFSSGDTQATLVREATITVLTPCQNPGQMAAPEVNFNDVTVRWYPVAQKYKVEWQPAGGDWSSAGSAVDITHNFYTITDLTTGTTYEYRVTAYCGDAYNSPSAALGNFTPQAAPDLLIYGSVFGGGRMADVMGKTEIVVVNCDSIGAIYGGNDIAGVVGNGTEGSNITLGVNVDDPHDYDDYGTTSAAIRIGEVYGGGNGYYTYDDHEPGPEIGTTYHSDHQFSNSVTDVGGGTSYMASGYIPSITKTAITVNNNYVKVDSIFGGAKNAFLTATTGNGSDIDVEGGTIFAVFGGNNYGGTQGAAKQYISVTNTKIDLTTTTGLGRTHGIGYLFGGGNKVAGSTTEILITGGQLDTIFGGGNQASVSAANLTVNCTGAKIISEAYDNGSINPDYGWDGDRIYNVHTLFGGNNHADMDGVPNVNLTSGGVGTVYGGGNAGDMRAAAKDSDNGNTIATAFGVDIDDGNLIKYSTHVHVDATSTSMIIDNLYGGCQVSNVDYSTWVEIKGGHIGNVYGGCNVSGDVGSVCLDYTQPAFNGSGSNQTANPEYQKVRGATYVDVSGGTIYRNLFAGSNGYYHCNDGVSYVSGMNYGDPDGHPAAYDPDELYVGLPVPTHNETNVKVSQEIGNTTLIKGNVYAGGNLACVGFTDYTVPSTHLSGDGRYPQFVGMATIQMSGGTVNGNVFGGGNMASIYGSNSVKVSGGTIDGALYGGNDRTGQVAQITNRVLPSSFDFASDNKTGLKHLNVKTYVSLTGHPEVGTVYGGGNGDYFYEGPNAIQFCGITPDEPIQANTFVDINIDNTGHIGTVYGGGNGVTVIGGITVFLNVDSPDYTADHVGTIFGGNNKGALSLVPDIILLNGQVGTVYGGCNQGAMEGWKSFTIGSDTYDEVGSMVRLRDVYTAYNNDPTPGTFDAPANVKITGAVYGGCRMNGVSHNSLVLVEGGNHTGTVYPQVFGGSDISGNINGTSQVVVTGGSVDKVIGGGNGDYYYANNNVYPNNDHNNPIATGTDQNPIVKPSTHDSRIDMTGGTANNLYAGGNACNSGATLTNMTDGTVNTGIYGGCNSSGNIGGNIEVNVAGGTVGALAARANIHGGGYGSATTTEGHVTVNIASNGATSGPTINGDLYGGSALGQVSASGKLTQVNIYKGTINGDVYGGGLGNNDNPAEVSGNVEVNIRGGVFNDATGTGNAGHNSNAGGRIFGCNNASGSPKGDVTVNIYATDHGTGHQNNEYPTNEIPSPHSQWNVQALNINSVGNEDYQKQTYAINSVFGGGNLAAYVPDEVGTGVDPHKATVHVYNCDNTIKDVFGGGNAADVGAGVVSTFEVTRRANTNVIIEGGRIHRVIGGGNGEDLNLPEANIFGTANTTVYAGLIDEVYGGANMQGSVDTINLTMSNPDSPTYNGCANYEDEVYGMVFGCANAAPFNKSVTTTIECGVGLIGELYGGSNQNYIGSSTNHNSGAHVTLNVYGGTHDKVFAGSKGIAGSPGVPAVPANIYGDVTLNLYGGTITHAFGGSDANGNISGTITVNVLDMEVCHPLDVTNVYGASNQTAYSPDDVSTGVKPISPVVNVIHIKNEHDNVIYGIRNNVYGGGNLAPVTSNPQVNIGYHSSMASLIPTNYPIAEADRHAYVKNNVYGGGNEAGVTGNPEINMRAQGTVVSGIYGGCNDDGDVDGNIFVNIYGGTLGTSSARMTEGIFGGGKGHPTGTTGDITVTVDDNETNHNIYADVYGGSALGQVGAAGKTALVDFKNGTLYGTIYGGGMGEGTTSATAATVTGNTEIAISGGTVIDGLYGGCNFNGIVEGNTTVGITNGVVGESSNANRGIVYGGGLGQYTKVKGDVAITVNGASVNSVNVYGDVYGGSAKGLVNCNDDGNGATAGSTTSVTLTNGTIHGDLYGGGHGLDNQPAHVYGPVTVAVNGSDAEVDDVFGCNNLNGAPQNAVTVNISDGLVNNVFGGGNVAAYVYSTDNNPQVNVSGGEVIHNVVGGGKAAHIGDATHATNPKVTISGGRVCTESTGLGAGAGVYGGCYSSGTVYGDIIVNITNDDGDTEIGTEAALENETPVSVHGGGYGSGTSTTGNVLVNFGTDTDGTHSDYPKLNGDLYGGSALGNVNSGAEDQTIVNIMNGSFGYVEHHDGIYINQFGGNIYGGGLGQQEILDDPDTPENEYQPDIAAKVWGVIHVNIGAEPVAPATTPTGKASLIGCNVYGCNNLNGSPQQNVFVDVYQTNHITTDYANYIDEETRTYAIRNVFGGGNRSNYHPDVNTGWEKRTQNYIHYCDNTVEMAYGGGNASDCDGVAITVDGGRFDFVFGGGNGQRIAANVGEGGAIINLRGGLIGWYFAKCNLHGTVHGTIHEHQGCDPNTEDCCDVFKIEKYYFGANEATIYEGITSNITCEQASFYDFRYVYAGSRLAVVYGDITLTIKGGTIGNLFGGSEGSADISADVRKYPTSYADIDNFPPEHQAGLRTYFANHAHDDQYGQGGNIILTINGGTIGNVFGGNDFRGNVEGTITVIIDSIAGDCPLDINYVYGGNNKARYSPLSTASGAFPDSPLVEVRNGHVNGAVYGGSKGGDPNHHYGNGEILNANPQVVIGDNVPGNKVKIGGVLHTITPPTMGEGNVFGGGMDANITGSPTVTLQGKVVGGKSTTTIEGNVFGGAKSGNVDGSTNVIIVPTSTP